MFSAIFNVLSGCNSKSFEDDEKTLMKTLKKEFKKIEKKLETIDEQNLKIEILDKKLNKQKKIIKQQNLTIDSLKESISEYRSQQILDQKIISELTFKIESVENDMDNLKTDFNFYTQKTKDIEINILESNVVLKTVEKHIVQVENSIDNCLVEQRFIEDKINTIHRQLECSASQDISISEISNHIEKINKIIETKVDQIYEDMLKCTSSHLGGSNVNEHVFQHLLQTTYNLKSFDNQKLLHHLMSKLIKTKKDLLVPLLSNIDLIKAVESEFCESMEFQIPAIIENYNRCVNGLSYGRCYLPPDNIDTLIYLNNKYNLRMNENHLIKN